MQKDFLNLLKNFLKQIRIFFGIKKIFKNFFEAKIISEKISLNFGFQEKIFQEKLKFFIKILIFLFFILLLINPSFGISKEDKESISYEIVFGIDNSLSMLAKDGEEKNRFERGKQKISEIVNSINGEFGLLEFSGESFISIPFTFDKNSFLIILEKVEINRSGEFGGIGTNFNSIGKNLNKFFEFKKGKNNKEKILILISDGENLGGKFGENNFDLEFFKKNKINILSIGFGKEEGSKIFLGKDEYGKNIFKKYNGEEVVSKLDKNFLENISEKTGGKYFHEIYDLGENNKNILNFIYKNFEKKIILEKNIREKKLFQFFAFLILLLIILEIFLKKIILKIK